MGNESADAGRDCRTRLARPNSQAQTRTRENTLFLSSLPRAELAIIPVDFQSAICDDYTSYGQHLQRSMYQPVHMFGQHIQQSMDQPGTEWPSHVAGGATTCLVANPARRQLNREYEFLPVSVRA